MTVRGQVRVADLWSDDEAATCNGELALRVYSSRLLGRVPSLVLHGGGNTSVKLRERDLFGDVYDLLFVKGSGWDLRTIAAAGFSPVRMDSLNRLSKLDELSDAEMARQLRIATIEPSAPAPSVEAILHAILPYRFVDHTHADAIVSITNTPGGRERIRSLYGDRVVVIPYVMPGFALSKLCVTEFPKQVHAGTEGMILMNHGIFTFGATARESYARMIRLVAEAEAYLEAAGAWEVDPPGLAGVEPDKTLRGRLAQVRHDVSRAAGRPMILSRREEVAFAGFARRPDVASIATRGPATPDHVLRTKRVPLVGTDVERYVADYRAYFSEFAAGRNDLTMLDPAPRVLLDETLGGLTVGATAAESDVVADVYRHTIAIILRSERLERWEALPARDLFDVEYWELEQAKLKRTGSQPPFQGEVALVTGAASGIGRACASAFLASGAAVVGLDSDPAIERTFEAPAYLGVCCDITDGEAVDAAVERAARRYGGLDILVLNAGMFPPSLRVADLDDDTWARTMRVNADANVRLLRAAHPLLVRAPRYGRVVVVASKNVPAPGPGAAAYSASKAALTQLARVTALEWGADGVRINVVHPDAVFDTGLWSDEVLAQRAAHYGLSVEAYKTKNVLRMEVRSAHVAGVVMALCTDAFAATTGAQVSVDGGNDRVI